MIFSLASKKTNKITNLLTFKYVSKFHFRRFYSEGPSFIVKQKLLNGQMRSDHKQSAVIQALQEVYENIKNYTPKKLIISEAPKGLYIYGSVGTGKTMLMDIFYQSVKVNSKRRSHFNNFMADVHSRIHQFQRRKRVSSQKPGETRFSDPIRPVAKQLVKEAWLLCFDEFQVTDIADAMILKRLFTEMFRHGMVMVATSNRSPEQLYKNGLQRSNFLPFIPILKKHCNVIRISGKDYRTSTEMEVTELPCLASIRTIINQSIAKLKGFLTNQNSSTFQYLAIRIYNIMATRTGELGTKMGMESAFRKLCDSENEKPSPRTLFILGHKITFKNACGRVLYTSFKELCEKPLGSADYIQIANHFDTILIKDVPKMTMDNRNQARRFILLIDTLYDKKVRIMMSAETKPQKLFSNSGNDALNSDQQRIIMDDLNIDSSSENAKASLFSGSEEIFAFERTVSRIVEMCSNAYWNQNGIKKFQ